LIGNESRSDLEALEMCIRSSMHHIGSKVLEGFINADGGGYQGKSLSGDNGQTYEFSEYRKKEVLTVLGTVAISVKLSQLIPLHRSIRAMHGDWI